MRKRYGTAWPLASFFLVYLIQQGMLVGLTLPLYAVFSSHRVWQPILDSLATAGCLAGKRSDSCFETHARVSPKAEEILKTSGRPAERLAARAGIGMAAVADNQLFKFMEGNERRLAAGKKPELLLDTGGNSKQPFGNVHVCHARSCMAMCSCSRCS